MPPANATPVASPFVTLATPPTAADTMPPVSIGGAVVDELRRDGLLPAAAQTRPAPTDEQARARDLYLTGGSLVIEAGAGTGKTTTLAQLANAAPNRSGVYIAFNKAIVQDAKRSFPHHIDPSTAHSLAWRAVVGSQASPWAARLAAARMRSSEIAKILGITEGIQVETPVGPKTIGPWRLAGWVIRALDSFCQTADFAPTAKHFPLLTGVDLQRGPYLNNKRLAAEMTPYLLRAWVDTNDPHGRLPWPHARYLKLWQLSSPNLGRQVVLCDEAQDLSPVIRDVVNGQVSCGSQVVWVGDSAQQIYSFTGAIDALARADAQHRAQLTQSWRFGQPIADTANRLLDTLDASLRLTGNPTRDSTLGKVWHDDDGPGPIAVLTRSNAAALLELIDALDMGIPAHLVGGGTELAAFTRAADQLQQRKRVDHPDLCLFGSWSEVQHYVDTDEQGGDLKLLVNLVDRFGPIRILRAIEQMPAESAARLVISTAHKAKGREWDFVRLADDFPTGLHPTTEQPVPVAAEELRLLYVAVTRARKRLDISDVEIFGRLADIEVAW
jgi:hypothetical protein